VKNKRREEKDSKWENNSKEKLKIINKKDKTTFLDSVRSTITLLFILFMTLVGFFTGWLSYEKFVVNKIEDISQTTVINDKVNAKDDTVDIVAKSMDSVVSIAINSSTFDEKEGVVNNIGSGFIVGAEGLILTNQHVVFSKNIDYIVVTADGEEYEILEIQRDDVNDIALLKVKLEDDVKLTPIELGDSSKLLVGQSVIAIGTPLGEYAGSVTTGVVSGLKRSVTTNSGIGIYSTQKTFENVIQTDAAVNPGNSGGPLLDDHGIVIGINFATTSGADNISFAIPINFVKDRLDEYRKYGKFRHPSIGLSYETVSKYQARFYKDLVAGALIVGIEENGPAAKAGLEKLDIITAINGEEFNGVLREVILKHDIGEKLNLTVWRSGAILSIDVILGEL